MFMKIPSSESITGTAAREHEGSPRGESRHRRAKLKFGEMACVSKGEYLSPIGEWLSHFRNLICTHLSGRHCITPATRQAGQSANAVPIYGYNPFITASQARQQHLRTRSQAAPLPRPTNHRKDCTPNVRPKILRSCRYPSSTVLTMNRCAGGSF